MVQKSPDLILYNGNVITLNEKEEVYDAIAIRDGRIMDVGSKEDLLKLQGFGTEIINIRNATVVPGFFDCNVHAIQTGLKDFAVDIRGLNKGDTLKKIKKVSQSFAEGQFIWGLTFDESTFETGETIDRWDLDKITSSHPIWLSRSEYHTTIVNTYAYNLLNLPWNIEGIEKNENGYPTGVLRGRASGVARRKMFELFVDDSLRKRVLEKMEKKAFSAGVTTFNAMEGGFFFTDEDVKVACDFSRKSLMDILVYVQTTDIEQGRILGLNKIGGNLFLDGTIGSKNAAISMGYEGNNTYQGILFYSQQELNEFVKEAHNSGMQISLSAIGDMAIEQAIEAIEASLRDKPKADHRHRIEHFILPTEQQIKRACDLGIILSMQPAFDGYWGGEKGMYSTRLGENYKLTNPLKKILDAGGIIVGGSESDITELSPLLGIHCAVNHQVKSNAISPMEALKMYTKNAAYANFLEHEVGTLEVGKIADLAILDKNPLEINPENIKSIKVKMTIKKGKIIFPIN